MVQRYSINDCASTGMDHNDEGDYILFDDYLDLKKTYDKVLEKLEEVASDHLSEGARYWMWKDIDSD